MQSTQVDRVADGDSVVIAAQLEAQLECEPDPRGAVDGDHTGKPGWSGLHRDALLGDGAGGLDALRRDVQVHSLPVGRHPVGGGSALSTSIDGWPTPTSRRCTSISAGGGMKIAVAHGTDMVFAKQVQIGGRQFDGLVSESTGCDTVTARMRRVTEGIPPDGTRLRRTGPMCTRSGAGDARWPGPRTADRPSGSPQGSTARSS